MTFYRNVLPALQTTIDNPLVFNFTSTDFHSGCLVDEVNHTRIHQLHQWPGIQSNKQYEDSQWNQRS